jgi:DNA mismatch repair protein MutL
MPIRVLSPEVADKIAAGEVIERPVSVAKELMENAIDAGADEIGIEIVQGGRRLIRVSDNGCGIAASEVEMAFARHATSKLSSADDLYRVQTLGFRGEALASIAAVSRLTLTTRTSNEEAGSLVRLEGGQIAQREPLGRPAGTTVLVENLFYNTPARLRFLRADTTEAGHIARLASSYALACPERRITLQNNDRLVLRTGGTGALLDAVIAIYGLDVAEQTLIVPPAEGSSGIRVWGIIGAPSVHRSNRQDIVLFVNRRWVQDASLSVAASDAYRTLLPNGRYPLVILNVELPPEDVDINIHPTKREVRFRHARDVFAAVQRTVRSTLMAQHPVPVSAPGYRGGAPEYRGGAPEYRGGIPDAGSSWQRREALAGLQRPASEQARLAMEMDHPGDRPATGPFVVPEALPERLPMLRVIGQVAQTYIIAEGPGGMYLIDQHAAHERIRYEELRAQRDRMGVPTQELLDPLPIELSPEQTTLLEPNAATLAEFGVEVVPFGGRTSSVRGNTFLIKRVPAGLADGDVIGAVMELLDAAAQGGEGFSWEDQILITLSCHTAVRAGQTLSIEEQRDLIRQLERASLPHTCPHGRPTMIHLSQAQLEREFGRR